MAIIHHILEHQGFSAGAAEIKDYLTEHLPNLFTSYEQDNYRVGFKNGTDTVMSIYNGQGAGSGITGTTIGNHAFNSSSYSAIVSIVIDDETETAAFITQGGMVLCTVGRNADGDVCCVYMCIVGGTNLLIAQAGTGTQQGADVYVCNLTRGTVNKNSLGFASTTVNAACGYPLVDVNGVKIQNMWINGCTALRAVQDPLHIIVDNTNYYSCMYGWILIA